MLTVPVRLRGSEREHLLRTRRDPSSRADEAFEPVPVERGLGNRGQTWEREPEL
jgi:hypothetical protein